MDRENDSDIELACLQQMRLVRFFGILTLILFVFGGLGLLAALALGGK